MLYAESFFRKSSTFNIYFQYSSLSQQPLYPFILLPVFSIKKAKARKHNPSINISIMQVSTSVLYSVSFSFSTNFQPCLRRAKRGAFVREARANQAGQTNTN